MPLKCDPSGKVMTIRFARLGGLVGALLSPVLASAPVQAADFPVLVDCPDWSGEQAGQVEARIRAALQADGLAATDVAVVCAPSGALEVRVASPDGALTRSVERRTVEDDVVWTVEAALDDLKQSAEQAPPPPAPVPPAAPPTAPPVVAAPPPAPPAIPVAPSPPRRDVELAARPLIERFSSLWAPGVEASGSVGSETLRLGLALGGRVALDEPQDDFQLSELTGTARLSLSPPRTAGIRVELGLGVSVLSVVPREGAITQSATSLTSGFLDLGVSRPFWLGNVAISPTLGARAFIARRRVDVDGEERFKLPTVVPQLGMSLIYRI